MTKEMIGLNLTDREVFLLADAMAFAARDNRRRLNGTSAVDEPWMLQQLVELQTELDELFNKLDSLIK